MDLQAVEEVELTKEEPTKEIKEKKLKKDQETTVKEMTVVNDQSSTQAELLLEDSVWAPKNRPCNRENSCKAKIASWKVPGDSKEYRVNYMKWVCRGNEHIKTIEEKFINGNSWIVIDFDCELSREMLSKWLIEKEGDWCKLIPEEDTNKRRIQVYRLPNNPKPEGSKPRKVKREALKSQEIEF